MAGTSYLLMNDLLSENYSKRIEGVENQVLDVCVERICRMHIIFLKRLRMTAAS